MRVVGGSARGVRLISPRGSGTRPTMDLVRGALFNILTPLGIEDALVMDLFAGTGSLGIEALSRGALHTDFVESSSQQCSDILGSLNATKLTQKAKIWHTTVEKALEQMRGKYDFVLMDPPYKDPFPAALLHKLQERALLEDDTVVVVGHSSRKIVPDQLGELVLWKDRRYGDSSLAIYMLGPEHLSPEEK